MSTPRLDGSAPLGVPFTPVDVAELQTWGSGGWAEMVDVAVDRRVGAADGYASRDAATNAARRLSEAGADTNRYGDVTNAGHAVVHAEDGRFYIFRTDERIGSGWSDSNDPFLPTSTFDALRSDVVAVTGYKGEVATARPVEDGIHGAKLIGLGALGLGTLGAGIGAAAGRDVRSTLIGGAVGAIVGAAVARFAD